MDHYFKYIIPLSLSQKKKLRSAFRRRKNAVIRLTRDQITVRKGDHILLSEQQYKSVLKAKHLGRGVLLTLDFDQLLKNKQGGLLKGMLQFVERVVPGGERFISPLIKNKLAPMLKEEFVPWLKNLIDNELDTIIDKNPTGSGLKSRINQKLDKIMFTVNKPSKKKSCKSAITR